MSDEPGSSGADAGPLTVVYKRPYRGTETTWTLNGTRLSKDGRRLVDLRKVTGGRFYSFRSYCELRLDTAKRPAKIKCYSPGYSDQRELQRFTATVLTRCQDVSPKARFDVGGGLSTVLSLFAFGLGVLAGGCFLIAYPFVNDEAGVARLGYVAGGVAVAILGVWMTWSARPWDYDRFMVPGAEAAKHVRKL